MDLGLEVADEGGVPVVKVSGEVDFGTAPRLRDAVVRIAMDGAPLAVVDLSDVEFLDSTGLGVLVACLKRFRTLGGDLRLVITRDRIRTAFEITGLDSAFSIHDTAADAVAVTDQ